MRDVSYLDEFRNERQVASSGSEFGPEAITEPGRGTVGELVLKLQQGEISFDQAVETLKSLDVIHWDISVELPEPDSGDREVEL